MQNTLSTFCTKQNKQIYFKPFTIFVRNPDLRYQMPTDSVLKHKCFIYDFNSAGY